MMPEGRPNGRPSPRDRSAVLVLTVLGNFLDVFLHVAIRRLRTTGDFPGHSLGLLGAASHGLTGGLLHFSCGFLYPALHLVFIDTHKRNPLINRRQSGRPAKPIWHSVRFGLVGGSVDWPSESPA